jgi:hypothetical protein
LSGPFASEDKHVLKIACLHETYKYKLRKLVKICERTIHTRADLAWLSTKDNTYGITSAVYGYIRPRLPFLLDA